MVCQNSLCFPFLAEIVPQVQMCSSEMISYKEKGTPGRKGVKGTKKKSAENVGAAREDWSCSEKKEKVEVNPCERNTVSHQMLWAEWKLWARFIRETLPFSHKEQKGPLCFLNSSKRSLSVAGSSSSPRLLVLWLVSKGLNRCHWTFTWLCPTGLRILNQIYE